MHRELGLMPVCSREICLLATVVFLLVVFLIYLYVEFVVPKPVVYEKHIIGSYHTSWCRDLNED